MTRRRQQYAFLFAGLVLLAVWWFVIAPVLWRDCRADGLSWTICARLLFR